LFATSANSKEKKAILLFVSADRVDNGDPSKIYICHECSRTFKHPGNFKQHLASHNRPPITCPPPYPDVADGDGGEPEPSNERPASRRSCPGLLPLAVSSWDCPECSMSFVRDTALQAHMKAVHDIEMVLPPTEARRLKVETREEEVEEEKEAKPKNVVEEEEEEEKSERRWQLRGKKRRLGRGNEERVEPEEEKKKKKKKEEEEEPIKVPSASRGQETAGRPTAKQSRKYFCDVPVRNLCHFQTYFFLNRWTLSLEESKLILCTANTFIFMTALRLPFPHFSLRLAPSIYTVLLRWTHHSKLKK
jgi:hypothetical protein